jgi:hypothetical protein
MMIDRFQCLWLSEYVFKTRAIEKNKAGAFICVSASTRKDFFENAKSIVKNFFAAVGAVYEEELLCSGLDKKGAVLKREDCLKKAFEIGQKIASHS